MQPFQSALVAIAERELAAFAGRHETDPDAAPKLLAFWGAVPRFEPKGAAPSPKARAAIAARTAWSAAFVSFCVREALASSGSAASFAFSASHSVYAGAAIRNDFEQAPHPAFVGWPPRGPGAVTPQPGDILGVTRTRSVEDYEDAVRAARRLPQPDSYFSHFDVVTQVSGRRLRMIGGNVSESVRASEFDLDPDGMPPARPFRLDQLGRVLSGPFICLIRHLG